MIPEYEPVILSEGTVPDAKLDAFRLVISVPAPKRFPVIEDAVKELIPRNTLVVAPM